MRNFLTFLAIALVTALTVALAVPPFIDWSARREMVARAVAARIGQPVEIAGAITLRLLPTPYLEIADVSVGNRGSPWLTGRAMRFEFGFASLFGRRIELDDVTFDHPSLHLGPHLAAPAEGRLDFQHIHAVHAEVRVEREGASPVLLHDASFDGSARSARGPWRGEGDFQTSQGRAHYTFATQAFAGDALPLKVEIDAGANRADIDGQLALSQSPAFVGTAILSGATTASDGRVWPWRVAGVASAHGDEAEMTQGQVRFGEDTRALEAEGRVAVRFGERPWLDADLAAKTLNFDSALRIEKETFVTPARAADAFTALNLDAPLAGFSLKLRAQSAYLGARMLEAPQLTLSGAPEGAMRLTLDSGLPGHGRIALDGTVEGRPAPIFRGKAQASVGDFATLGAWIGEGQPDWTARLAALAAALPQGGLSAAGNVEASPQGYAVRDLKLGAGPSRFDGSVVYRLPSAQERARLYLDLASDALDIDAAPNVEAGFTWLGDADLDFRLKAGALRVARLGLASVSGGSLVVRAKKEGLKFTLQKLSLADLGGASIDAEGEASPSGRWTRVKLDAEHLSDFAALLVRAAPGEATTWLQRRAGELGAAKATFEARRDGPPLSGPFGLDFLKADGEVAGARFGLTLSRAPAPVDAISAEGTLDSLDAGALLRKLGLKLARAPAGRAELSLSGTGQWDRGFAGKARLNLAGAEMTWSGAFRPQAQGATLSGPMSVKSADLFPALAALGYATAGNGAKAPGDLSADLEAGADGVRLGDLKGALAGSRVSGELAWARTQEAASAERLIALAQGGDAPAAALTGALAFDHASLGALLSLVLGRPGPARPNALGSEAKWEAPLLTPPSLDIALKVDALDSGFGVARSLTARLQMERDRLALDDVSALINGGKASGRLDLRRSRTQTTASGALGLADVGIERPGLVGRVDAGLDFVGSGDSAASLVAGLAGAGKLKVGEIRIARLDPQALARVYQRTEQNAGAPPEEKALETQIDAELDKGSLAVAHVEGGLALSSGALRFGPLDAGETRVSGALGLSDLALSLEAVETVAKPAKYWSGPPPSVTVAAGPSGRSIDVALLAAGLATEAIARETERIANFEADVRERAMFNRGRKAWAFLDRRAEEIAAYLADEAQRLLMKRYLGPYTQYGASRRETAPAAKNAAGL